MHNTGYKSALARRVCRYSDARPPRKTDGILLESEILPRMRGKDKPHVVVQLFAGITPAYAGKRGRSPRPAGRRRDHPRICREKGCWRFSSRNHSGLPPHMRGKKRRPRRFRWGSGKDHPRMCGEKSRFGTWLKCASGSPPHMRGKGRVECPRCGAVGITPAYAGKSYPMSVRPESSEDHPRICGEKFASSSMLASCSRITPAYAGKRSVTSPMNSFQWDHPRICGEKCQLVPVSSRIAGSPPHMRGKGGDFPGRVRPQRITPAYAGKRYRGRGRRGPSGDHPRICGEKPPALSITFCGEGSPPHMRGKVSVLTHPCKQPGITPAYAGKRLTGFSSGLSGEDHPRICGEKPVL